MWRYIIRRLAWTVFAVYFVLSGAFVVFAYTPDPNRVLVALAGARKGAAPGGPSPAEAQSEAVAAFNEARNYDVPVLTRYIDWMTDYATLDWGWSFTYSAPVTDVLAQTIPITLVYLLPAVFLSVVCGIAAGLYAATHQHGLFDRVATTVAYVGFGTPALFLGEVMLVLVVRELGYARYDPRFGLWTAKNLVSLTLPMVVVTTNLFAVQLRYARAETAEYLPTDFVKTLRANGAGALAVARHLLRNAAVPLLSLFFTEALTVLFVTIYVIEVVFEIPGVGRLAYQAILNRDIGLILATTLVPVLVGLLGNLFQDIAYTVLDPRIGSKTTD